MPDWLPTSLWFLGGRSNEVTVPNVVPLGTWVPGFVASSTTKTESLVPSGWSAVACGAVPARKNVYPEAQWSAKSPQSEGWAALVATTEAPFRSDLPKWARGRAPAREVGAGTDCGLET